VKRRVYEETGGKEQEMSVEIMKRNCINMLRQRAIGDQVL